MIKECCCEEKEKEIETSDTDFSIFQEECKRWIEYFGLFGWQVYYVHKELKGSFAECHYDIDARCATFLLNKKWPEDLCSMREIKHSAFHEVCELLLARINCLARSRFINADELSEEVHNLIRIFERKIFKRK